MCGPRRSAICYTGKNRTTGVKTIGNEPDPNVGVLNNISCVNNLPEIVRKGAKLGMDLILRNL